ncbi:hypothetical protein [Thalassomonas actiniarum]|uniref:Uncharacterized protein n=1 Tax=Thalassomonas actiniarum TaxID=485447 RepID=A0AAF0C0D3_9GAMM|nr:hypothetical protein [Thalassomonas actiniarum]WDD98331.1 hypothetical protein SG35_024160 [Thalassomonas actiniarum]
MNKRMNKKLVLAGILVTALATNASAQQVSVETTVSQFVVAQGQQMVTELTQQLSHSISQEIREFKAESALLLSGEAIKATADKKQNSQEHKNYLQE